MKSFFSGMLTTFIPGGGFTIIFTGVLLIITSILIIIRKFEKEAAMTLAIMLGLFILTIHIPHLVNPETMNPDFAYKDILIESNVNMFVWINLLKDISLFGASLFVLGAYIKDNQKNEA